GQPQVSGQAGDDNQIEELAQDAARITPCGALRQLRQQHGRAAQDEGQCHAESLGGFDPERHHQAGDRARHTAQGADDACHSRGAQLGLVDNVVGIVHKPGIPEYGAEEIEQQHSYG
ncbi:hypothetical protein PKCEKB_PKCEKB_06940, partial [Dysosmobacter welbionis]